MLLTHENKVYQKYAVDLIRSEEAFIKLIPAFDNKFITNNIIDVLSKSIDKMSDDNLINIFDLLKSQLENYLFFSYGMHYRFNLSFPSELRAHIMIPKLVDLMLQISERIPEKVDIDTFVDNCKLKIGNFSEQYSNKTEEKNSDNNSFIEAQHLALENVDTIIDSLDKLKTDTQCETKLKF